MSDPLRTVGFMSSSEIQEMFQVIGGAMFVFGSWSFIFALFVQRRRSRQPVVLVQHPVGHPAPAFARPAVIPPGFGWAPNVGLFVEQPPPPRALGTDGGVS